MKLLHWIAHRLRWNACRVWSELDAYGYTRKFGYQCVGCGKVTVLREPAAWWMVYCHWCGANGPMSAVIVFERDDEISRDEARELWNARHK